MWGNVKGTIQDRRHQTQEQEEGRTTTRTTIATHKGKEAKRNGSKPERYSSCVLWRGGAAPSPPCPLPALGNQSAPLNEAEHKKGDTKNMNTKKKEEQRK